MTDQEIYKKLNEIFREVFNDTDITVNENTTANDIEDWDSFEHINLIVTIEEEFEIKLSMDEIGSMKSVGSMAEIIKEHTKK